jgi:hypothetical protein
VSIEIYDAASSTSSRVISGPLPDYDGLLVEFPRDMDEYEHEVVRGIVCYAAFLPYFSNGTDVNEWLSPRHFWIDASSYRSRSSNWREHEPFALLEEFLLTGTPKRKRQDDTRKWHGVGVAPARLILNHPGDKAPPTTAEPLNFEREGRKGPLFGLTSAHDLLRLRTT